MALDVHESTAAPLELPLPQTDSRLRNPGCLPACHGNTSWTSTESLLILDVHLLRTPPSMGLS